MSARLRCLGECSTHKCELSPQRVFVQPRGTKSAPTWGAYSDAPKTPPVVPYPMVIHPRAVSPTSPVRESARVCRGVDTE